MFFSFFVVYALSPSFFFFFFFNDPATTEIYTLSLHDALPIWTPSSERSGSASSRIDADASSNVTATQASLRSRASDRSEEHTSELQSHSDLVCRLLLEKKKKKKKKIKNYNIN